MTVGLAYRGDDKNLFDRDTPLKRAYFSGDEDRFMDEAYKHYEKKGLLSRSR